MVQVFTERCSQTVCYYFPKDCTLKHPFSVGQHRESCGSPICFWRNYLLFVVKSSGKSAALRLLSCTKTSKLLSEKLWSRPPPPTFPGFGKKVRNKK